MPDLVSLGADLAAEQAALDKRVADAGMSRWATPTPARGWDVTDCISHLAYFDHAAALALVDPDGFRAQTGRSPAPARPDVAFGRDFGPAALLAEWREARRGLLAAVAGADPALRVPWYGPSMGVASFMSARLMEVWAHGQDVADALGLAPVVSARLRHVCHLGVTARPYAFAVHGVTDSGQPVRVEAAGPDGERWTWGPEDAPDRLAGPALDLALVFTQRRHPSDTAVFAEGPTAMRWLAIAQCFAGPAGEGRAPRPARGAVTPPA